ncbi:hypothetical protein BD770DRAFT_385857, partial [Pilaira anomala]
MGYTNLQGIVLGVGIYKWYFCVGILLGRVYVKGYAMYKRVYLFTYLQGILCTIGYIIFTYLQ